MGGGAKSLKNFWLYFFKSIEYIIQQLFLEHSVRNADYMCVQRACVIPLSYHCAMISSTAIHMLLGYIFISCAYVFFVGV